MKAGNEARRDRGRGSHPEAEADGYQVKAEAATPRPRQMDIKARPRQPPRGRGRWISRQGRGSHPEVEADRRRSGPEKQKHDENKRQALLDIIRHNFYDTGLYRGTTAVLLRKC